MKVTQKGSFPPSLTPQQASKPDLPGPHRIKVFQELMENLAPGHSVMMRIRLDKRKQVIESEQVVLVRSTAIIPDSEGHGPLPEDGSHWGLVATVSSDGHLEMSGEYRVLRPEPLPSKDSWKAKFEKTSNNRKIFSLIDLKLIS